MKIPAGEKGIPMIRWNKVEGKSKPSIYYVFSTTKLSATKTMAASKTPNPVELEKLLTCILDSLALNFEFSQALPGFDGYTNTIKLPASSIELSNVIELAFATALAVQQEKALAINPPKATMTMNDANRFVLTAHLTAQMLCSAFNVLPESRFHTGTQNLWIPLLKQDPAMLIQAAASAQKIFDFMYTGLTPAETKAITEQAVS